MRRIRFLLLLILASVLFVPFYTSTQGSGGSGSAPPTPTPTQGLVCFSSIISISCPSSPVQFTAPPGGTFTAYVVIQGSQSFNSFNIWFSYPYAILNATSVSVLGSVLPGVKVQFECINGRGSASCGAWLGNGPGIVALSATGNLTVAPTTGLLYSVTFQVTGNGSGNLGFFCVTSPSGPWLVNCASVSNGSTLLSINVQGASFVTDPPSSVASSGGGAGGGMPPRQV